MSYECEEEVADAFKRGADRERRRIRRAQADALVELRRLVAFPEEFTPDWAIQAWADLILATRAPRAKRRGRA